MATSKKFPSEVYVYWDEYADGDSAMLVRENPEDAVSVGNKVLLGVYKLQRTTVVEGVVKFLDDKKS